MGVFFLTPIVFAEHNCCHPVNVSSLPAQSTTQLYLRWVVRNTIQARKESAVTALSMCAQAKLNVDWCARVGLYRRTMKPL